MKDHFHFLRSADFAIDYIINFFSILLGYFFVSFWDYERFSYPQKDMLVFTVTFCLALSLFYSRHNVYHPMRTKKISFFVSRILLADTEGVALCLLLIFLLHRTAPGAYIKWLVISLCISLSLILSKKVSMLTILHGMRTKRKDIKYILMVTDNQEMVDSYFNEVKSNPRFGYEVIGYVGNSSILGLPHLGNFSDLDRVIKEFLPDEVMMAFDTVRKKSITKYVDVCNDNCCKVMFIPAICGYFRAPRQVTVMGNIPLIDIRSNPLDNVTNQMMKRLLDIVVSAILIILSSPVMLAVAIGVKLSSPGPILFKQTRVGKNNVPFTMYKFRSMRVNDSEQTGWSNEKDPRKTKFGAFIRKVALDELPQFFNVLKGDMSLVGPRPEVPFYVEKFKKEVPLYMLKHTLRPGITGLAQIKGLRGDTSIARRIEEDINYIENWSFWGDIRILILTPFHAINRHEKYVENDEKDAKKQLENERRTYQPGWEMKTEIASEDSAEHPQEPNVRMEPLWEKTVVVPSTEGKLWEITTPDIGESSNSEQSQPSEPTEPNESTEPSEPIGSEPIGSEPI